MTLRINPPAFLLHETYVHRVGAERRGEPQRPRRVLWNLGSGVLPSRRGPGRRLCLIDKLAQSLNAERGYLQIGRYWGDLEHCDHERYAQEYECFALASELASVLTATESLFGNFQHDFLLFSESECVNGVKSRYTKGCAWVHPVDQAKYPPSIVRAAPVTKLDSGPAR
jgi:hypothetical protein